VPRYGYRIGVPQGGRYQELINLDSAFYGGSNVGNGSRDIVADGQQWMGRPHSITLDVPPLAGIVLAPIG
jgi:1,4-alpha-glucan branching enzyme